MNKFKIIMRCIAIILFWSFISCEPEIKLENGFYYASAKTYITNEVEKLNRFRIKDFNKLKLLSEEQNHKLNEIILNNKYHSKSDLGTCIVDGCIIEVQERKIKNKIYFTCNSVQLQFYEQSKFIKSILLNEQGILQIDILLKEIEK